MVQVIGQGRTKPLSKSQQFGIGINQALETGKQYLQQRQQQQQEEQALKEMGLPESARYLPPEAKAEYFKNAFAREKSETELQKSQRLLNEAKLAKTEEETSFFQKLTSGNQKNPPIQTTGSELDIDHPETWSNDILKKFSAFEGQPGQKGVVGTMAANELKDRETKEKKNIEKDKDLRKQFEADRDYHSKVSRPIIESANERLQTSSINKGVREQLKIDIASGETSGFWPYMVDRLGLESFRNPESARFSNEVKNIFVGSLNEIPGARPNQFLERLLSSAQPQIGRSPEANLSVMDVADFVEDLRDEQARQELEIAKQDRKEYGYVREDVADRARENMGDYANRKQQEMAMKIQERHESSLDNSELINEILSGKTTPGSYVTPRIMRILWLKNGKDMQKATKEAENLGLTFPNPEYLEK